MLQNFKVGVVHIPVSYTHLARAKADKLIQEAIEAGNVEAKPILENGEKEKESIRNLSPTLKENAINIVVERIVKIHGNS